MNSECVLNASIAFSAGAVGGLANGVAVWFSGKSGISNAIGVKIEPDWTPAWIYPRIVWGGLWGFLFLLPYFQDSYLKQGLIYSLGPTIAVLFIVFPYQLKKGMLGLELGKMTPLFALVVNAVWGVAAAWWLSLIH